MSRPLFPFTIPGAIAAPLQLPAWSLALPTLRSLLDLLPPFLLAVPKKKVSHSRKRMRNHQKYALEDKRRELYRLIEIELSAERCCP